MVFFPGCFSTTLTTISYLKLKYYLIKRFNSSFPGKKNNNPKPLNTCI
jgi:hypothetical protein